MTDFAQARVITAIKTPYLPDRSIDLEAFDRLVERQIEAGVQGLIIGGTTGEGHLMGWDEHVMLIAHSVNQFGDRLLIVGNTGSNNTKEVVKATEHGFAVGMDAALLINPYYGKTNVRGMTAHLKAGLDIGPAIVYNVPGRTGQDIPSEVIEALAGHENLLGVKECVGPERIAHYRSLGIGCWSGNDDDCHQSRHQSGAYGVISVTSNLLPKTMLRLMEQPDEALNQRLGKLFAWLFQEPNPIALNTVSAMLGLCLPVFRLPYVPLTKEQRAAGLLVLQELADLGELPEAKLLEDEDYSWL
ncbi:MAG: 4-hydroxy-tetrahydrodipicolinate synthase [bacterium]|nr:4-hydroxy-tetrahydrodipicolinate synthase [bacterium]